MTGTTKKRADWVFYIGIALVIAALLMCGEAVFTLWKKLGGL